MSTAKKITVDVPANLLAQAQAETGEGISETVRRGLQLLASARAFHGLLSMRGKVKNSVSWKTLKEDRE